MAKRQRSRADRTARAKTDAVLQGDIDPNALVQAVLRQSYLETTEELRYYVEKVRRLNECKKLIRDYLQKLRDVSVTVRAAAHASRLPRTSDIRFANAIAALFDKHSVVIERGESECDLPIPERVPPKEVNSFESLDGEIARWEGILNSLGDDAQLANVDLQNILQKQQQTLQMMSNISKMLHDTAMSVIKKMGG